MESKKYPNEPIDLPSKGWFYPKESPLASGTLDVYLMRAVHEDILTSQNLIAKGVVIDRLLEALIATPGVKYDELLLVDRNALMIAARILGYGRHYTASITCTGCGVAQEATIDLQELKEKELPEPTEKGKNYFEFTLPISKKVVGFKLLNGKDENLISAEMKAIQKISPGVSKELTIRTRQSIVSIDGDTSRTNIQIAVDDMLAGDGLALRKYMQEVSPEIDMTIPFECRSCEKRSDVEVPIDVTFFWPNARV